MSYNIYKRGQGKYTRLCSAFTLAIIIGMGCMRLYRILEASTTNSSSRVSLWVVTMIPAGLFVSLVFLSFWLVNKPKIADFMIAAEGEMKKVSWSSRQEIAVSTAVVIIVVILMTILLGMTDLTFMSFFRWLFK